VITCADLQSCIASEAAIATSGIGAGAATPTFTGWLADRYNPRSILLITYAGVVVSAWPVFNGSDGCAWQYPMSFTLATFVAASLFTSPALSSRPWSAPSAGTVPRCGS
jgi:nitrate/nitrite transporter NarK